ncbi:UDP-N-acetylglucosamine1-carboxyvinyltransferase, partial [Striga asiatica]
MDETGLEESLRMRFMGLEVENVKKFYSNLKSYNSKLKAIKEEFITQMINKFPIKEESRLEIRRVNFGADLTEDYRVITPNQHPYIPNPTAQHEFYYSIGPEQTRDCHASNSGPTTCADYVGPLGIDLNFPAAEAFGLDSLQPLDGGQATADRRAGFAEARRKRRGLMRAKSVKSGI